MSDLDDVVKGLLAERYRRSVWWKSPDPTPVVDDDLTIARRRRELAQEAS